MSASSLSALIKYNSKILCKALLAAVLFSALLPFALSLHRLNPLEAARTAEVYLGLLGLLLFPSLAQIDFEVAAAEIVSCQLRSKALVFSLRLLLSIGVLSTINTAFLLYMRALDCRFNFALVLSGTLITQLALGLVGATVAAACRTAAAGYLTAFGYFLLDYTTRGRITGPLYLFSLSRGMVSPKLYLLALALALILITNAVLQRRSIA